MLKTILITNPVVNILTHASLHQNLHALKRKPHGLLLKISLGVFRECDKSRSVEVLTFVWFVFFGSFSNFLWRSFSSVCLFFDWKNLLHFATLAASELDKKKTPLL